MSDTPHTLVMQAKGLVKRYGQVTALDGADFELRAGEILAVIGDNGAGKSSLIKCLSGATVPDEGTLYLDGQPIHFKTPIDARRAGIETVYQDSKDKSGQTLYGIYHNENYPSTLPYDSVTKEGYRNVRWPQGLTGPESPAAVCRIGVMKSIDGGKSWDNRGIFIEDYDPRMIRKPFNTSNTFAGGVGDPSAVASGDYLYLFYGEYGYPGVYDEKTYRVQKEWSGQCISIARIALKDLDNPVGKAKRWDGKSFSIAYDSYGVPVRSLQIPINEGGGGASSPTGGFHWGPSVSWNTYLNCWVMMMGKVEGKSWQGDKIYISFNKHKDLGIGKNSQVDAISESHQ